MKAVFWGLLLSGLFVLQNSVFPLFTLDGVGPDLLLVAVVSGSILQGRVSGFGVGFFAGLLQDLGAGGIFGFHLLTKMCIGYSCGLMERQVYQENVFLPMLTVAAATAGQLIFQLVFLLTQGFSMPWLEWIGPHLLWSVIYNMLVTVPIHWLVGQIYRFSDSKSENLL